jgi:hypothetical protein
MAPRDDLLFPFDDDWCQIALRVHVSTTRNSPEHGDTPESLSPGLTGGGILDLRAVARCAQMAQRNSAHA